MTAIEIEDRVEKALGALLHDQGAQRAARRDPRQGRSGEADADQGRRQAPPGGARFLTAASTTDNARLGPGPRRAFVCLRVPATRIRSSVPEVISTAVAGRAVARRLRRDGGLRRRRRADRPAHRGAAQVEGRALRAGHMPASGWRSAPPASATGSPAAATCRRAGGGVLRQSPEQRRSAGALPGLAPPAARPVQGRAPQAADSRRGHGDRRVRAGGPRPPRRRAGGDRHGGGLDPRRATPS